MLKKKAPMQRIADKWASILVPTALFIAVISGIIMNNIEVAVTVLVVFCPCALVLATPTAIMAAIGQATKHGIVIKSGEALEKLGKINVAAFDKTGTITKGKLQVQNVIVFDQRYSEDKLIFLAASAESKSEHPLGKAIVEYARNQNIELQSTESFNTFAGKGIKAKLNNHTVLCGNKTFIAENNVEIPDSFNFVINGEQYQGMAYILIAVDKVTCGAFILSDTMKEKANETISSLKLLNVEAILLTGDNEKTASFFSEKAGIKKFYANLLPQDKVEKICLLQKEGKTVCMIGDGVNDAPALKTADVGIAMGTMGSDISVEAADIALLGDDISKLPYLKKLSNKTMNTIMFSISLSLFINLVGIILSLLQLLTPTTGALVHNAGSLLVIFIASRLYNKKI